MSKENLMNFIVIVSLVLYIAGVFVVGRASLMATDGPPEVQAAWVSLVTTVTAILSLNAGAYFGLPKTTKILPTSLNDPDAIRGWAAGIYFVVLVVTFLIVVNSEFPHESLTDVSAEIIGFIGGVVTVFLGRP